MRRQFNLAFFERLLIDEDYNVKAELAPPFDVILGDELRRRAVIAEADEATRLAVEEALRQSHVQIVDHNEQRPQAGWWAPTRPRPLSRSWVGVRSIWRSQPGSNRDLLLAKTLLEWPIGAEIS